MQESSIQIRVKGPDHEQVSGELSDFFKSRFGHRPVITETAPGEKQEGKKDFIGAAALIVGIISVMVALPGSVLASRDLMDRVDKKKKADDLIDLARELHEKYPDTDVTINLSKEEVTLHTIKTSTLLDEFDK